MPGELMATHYAQRASAGLLFEVLEAVCKVWGSGRVGVRLSPFNSYNDMIDSDPVGLTAWLAGCLNDYRLAYPDVPERIRRKAALNAPDPATFYTPGPQGYTDYPTLEEGARS